MGSRQNVASEASRNFWKFISENLAFLDSFGSLFSKNRWAGQFGRTFAFKNRIFFLKGGLSTPCLGCRQNGGKNFLHFFKQNCRKFPVLLLLSIFRTFFSNLGLCRHPECCIFFCFSKKGHLLFSGLARPYFGPMWEWDRTPHKDFSSWISFSSTKVGGSNEVYYRHVHCATWVGLLWILEALLGLHGPVLKMVRVI